MAVGEKNSEFSGEFGENSLWRGRAMGQVRKNVKNYHLRDGMELVGENEGRYLICVSRVSMI